MSELAKKLDALTATDGIPASEHLNVRFSIIQALAAVARDAAAMRDVARDYAEFDGDRRSIAEHLGDAERSLDASLAALTKEIDNG